MIRPKIGLDWDDVTAPFNSIAIEMANEKYHPEQPYRLKEITSWANTGRTGIIREFYSDPELYRKQSERITEETKHCIRMLEERADVFFITAVHPDFMGIRAKQIREAFPELPNERIILGSAKRLVHFDIILDDNIDNVLDSPAEFAVLMRKPWNQKMTGLLSVNTMSEFVTLVSHIFERKHMPEKKGPKVIALVGPAGSGKSLAARTLCADERYQRPVTYTTKPCTDSSELPKHIPLAEEEFLKQDFFEHTMYAGYHYGTQKADIERVLNAGKNAVLALDMCGAIAMKQAFPTDIVFCRRGKEELIRNIVNAPEESLSDEEKVLCLLSLEAERKNAEICDLVIEIGEHSMAQDQLDVLLSL